MADEDQVTISFTAQIDSLKEGIEQGEALIKSFSEEITTLQTRINSLSEVGGDWAALHGMRAMETEIVSVGEKTDILREKLAQVSAEQARSQVQQFKPVSIQFAIDENLRLNEAMTSGAASGAVFQKTLGSVGISATEAAIHEREAAAAADALNRATGSFYQTQTSGRAAVQSNLTSLMGQTTAYNSGSAAARAYGSLTGEITSRTSQFAGAMGGLRVQTAGVTREIIVLAHEMVMGRFSRVPGSLMVLGEMMGGLSLSTIATVGAFAVAAGAIGYFIYRAAELASSIKEIQLGATFAGNADITNAAIESTIVEMGKLHGMTRETAEQVIADWSRMRDMSVSMMKTMVEASREYGNVTGTTAKDATNKLVAAMKDENITFQKLADLFPGATSQQLEEAEAAMRSGDAHQRQAAIMDLLHTQLGKTREQMIAHDVSTAHNIATIVQGLPVISLFSGVALWNEERALRNATKAVDDNTAALAKNAAEKRNAPETPEERRSAADVAADVEDPKQAQIAATKQHIKELQDAIDKAYDTGGKPVTISGDQLAKWGQALDVAKGHLAQLQHQEEKKANFGTNLAGQEEIRQVKETNAAVSADIKLSTAEQKSIIMNNWKELLATGKMTADQRKDIEREMWTATGAAARAGAALTVAQARNSIAQITADEKLGSTEKLAAIVSVWAKVKDNDKLGFQERLAAATEYYKAEATLEKQQQSISVAAARSNAQTAIEVSKLRIAGERADLNESFKLHQTSATERTALLTKLAEEEEKLDEEALDAELALLHEGDAGYAEAVDRKILLRERLKAERLRIAREEKAEEAANAREEVTTHRLATNEILNAERGLVRGIISGRQSAAQIAGNLIDNLLEKELDADLQYLTKHLLMSQAELAADKTSDQAGLLWHTIFTTQKTAVTAAGETAKTGATAAGVGARTGIQAAGAATENIGFLARVGKWIATELGMTAATTVGEATRTTEKAAAVTATAAATAPTNLAMAESYSALASVEAAASVAAIPFVGWSMAPGVAASTYAMLQPMAALAALDVGAWNVPKDMPAYIHKGESVVPKTFAEGLRENGGAIGGQEPKIAGAMLTYAPTVNAPAAKSLEQHLRSESAQMLRFLNDAIRNGDLNHHGS